MPTRVFSGLLEYDVSYDPSIPLSPGDPDPSLGGNGSWKLVRNWAICADGASGSAHTGISSGNINSAERLNNGKAYVEVSSGSNLLVYRLSDDGTSPMISTTTSFTDWKWKQLFRDGSLGYTEVASSPIGYTNTVYISSLLGFDSSANPIWNAGDAVAAVTSNSISQPHISGGWNTPFTGVEATTGGYYPIYMQGHIYNSTSTTNYPHLGAFVSGNPSYSWTAMPEVCYRIPDYHGEYPCTNSYGGHNGIGPERTEGRSIFLMYDGQYASYGDQIYQYWEDGLLVGQFGNRYPYLNRVYYPAPPGQAGNIGSFSTVSYNGDIYLYHSDEADHSPIHRWHISNLQSIHEYSATALPGVLTPVQLLFLF